MSYSFVASGTTKMEIMRKVHQELTDVVAAQPVHGADKKAAMKAADALIVLMADPGENQKIVVSINGSLGWNVNQEVPKEFTSANVSVSVSLINVL
jgi:hypothetical protein